MALAALDFNKDNLTDLVVSAPSVGSPYLTYAVSIEVQIVRALFLSAGFLDK